jgi:hypothetical protein
MKRMELIANHSVEEEIINALERRVKNFYYIQTEKGGDWFSEELLEDAEGDNA